MSQRKVTSVYPDTGAVSQADPTFELSGIFDVVLSSTYVSDLDIRGALGRNRLGSYDPRLVRLDDGRLEYRDTACMAITFARPTPNPGQWNAGDHVRIMEIAAGPDRTFMIREDGIVQHFVKAGEAHWNLSAIEDRNGTRLEFQRDSAGLISEIKTPEGLRLEFKNDTAKGLRTSVDLVGLDGSRAQVMRYAYDANDNLTLAEAPFEDKHEYGYDGQNLQTWVRINDQFEARLTYDGDNRCVLEQTNGAYDGTTFQYDSDRKITTRVPAGDEARTERLYYDEDGGVFAVGHVSGRFDRTYLNKAGQIAATQDGNGNKTSYRYDPNGNLTTVEDPEGRLTDLRWTEDGLMEFAIDPSGAAWENDYDEFGNLTSTKDALGFNTEFKNNDLGQPTGFCRHDGLIQFFAYDDNHMLSSITDFDGLETTFERDGFGRVTATVVGEKQRTEFEYSDQVGWDFWTPSLIRLNDEVQFQTQISEPRRKLAQIDGSGRRTEYILDGFGKVEESRDPDGGTLKFRYDKEEDLVEVENQISQVWTFDRDDFGRVSREVDFGGSEITYEYDDGDHLIASASSDGTHSEYENDKSGLMTKETVFAPDQEPLVTRYQFDERALLRTATTSEATVTFERDANGQVIAEIVNGTRIENTYDCCGRRESRTIGRQIVTFGHDAVGRLQSLQVGPHSPLDISRDVLGHETRRTSQSGFDLQQSFDLLGQLREQSASVATTRTVALQGGQRPDGRFAIARTYQWSPSLEPTSITDSGWGGQNYTYNRVGQISETTHGDGALEGFDYDPRLTIDSSRLKLPSAEGAAQGIDKFSQWTAGSDGRVQTAQGASGEAITLTYDAKGRVVEKLVHQDGFRPQTWRFEWNGLDRMVAAYTPDGDKWSYAYDAFARRISKQQWTGQPVNDRGASSTNWTEGTRHDYLWDGDVIASETVTSARGETRQTSWFFEPSTFVPIARETDGQLSFVITDHLGTPRELVSETGDLEWAAELSTWGRVRRVWAANDNAGPSPCPIRFQGQWEDDETGLHYNRFRYYEPDLGSYLAPDPLGLVGGFRIFAYTHIPTILIDPFGLYGVYVFKVLPGARRNIGKCYVGRGNPKRFGDSQKQRTGFTKDVKCARKNSKGRHYDTDKAAAAAGADKVEFGKLVEHVLIGNQSGFGAVGSPAWLNAKLDGQKAWSEANKAQRSGALTEAKRIRGLALADSGCS